MLRSLLPAVIALAALLGGVLAAAALFRPSAPAFETGVLLPEPRPLPALPLLDESAAPTLLNAARDEWTLVFPGFTYCPDICPTTLAQLAGLPPRVEGLKVRLLTIDPARDDPARLKAYVQHFDPRLGAWVAGDDALPEVARALSIAYVRVPQGEDGDYTMDHSTALTLIGPEGRIRAFFTPPFDIEGMAADIGRLIAKG
jgi:protein SCO1/2